MKTIYSFVMLMLTVLVINNGYAEKFNPHMMRSIHVVICSKAYWDGPSKSCIPREKGGCCHIWMEGMVPGPGEITGEMAMVKDRILQLTVYRGKGMNNETFLKYFSNNTLTLDGPVTFEPEVLSRLGVEWNYMIPPGTYPVVANGDQLTITFK